MEFKRKGAQRFSEDLGEGKKERSCFSARTDRKKFSEVTASTKSRVSPDPSWVYSDSDRFVPKNLILCLVIRKVVLSKLTKLINFGFNMIRSLYKEWKIETSPRKRKGNTRSFSGSFKAEVPSRYYKKTQEKCFLMIIEKKRNRVLVNKLFFMWNKRYLINVERKNKAVRKFEIFFNKGFLKSAKDMFSGIKKMLEKFKLSKIFIQKVDTILKHKIFKFIFTQKFTKVKIAVSQYQTLNLPSSLMPVFIEEQHKSSRKKVFSLSHQKGKFIRGILALINFKGLRRLAVERSFNKIKEFSKTEKQKEKRNACVSFLFSISNFVKTRKKIFFQMMKTSLNEAYLDGLLFSTVEKFNLLLSSVIRSRNTQLKIFSFSQLALNYLYFLRSREISQGFYVLSKSIRSNILSRMHTGLASIRSFRPVLGLYKSQLIKFPWLIKNIYFIIKSHKTSLKKHSFSSIYYFYLFKKIKAFTLILISFRSSQDRKQKRAFFNSLKKTAKLNKRLYLNFRRSIEIVKKYYRKKITYAFIHWESKACLSKYQPSSIKSRSKYTQNKRRTNSYSYSTLETAELNSFKHCVNVLPYPKNIHDYIDDFIEVTRTKTKANYFNI